MPSNKNALLRLVWVDKCLSDKLKEYSISDITDICNRNLEESGYPTVSKRCIEKDIVFIEGEPFNADIDRFRSEGRNCVRYSDKSFSIFRKALSEEERLLLAEVLNTLGQFEGLNNFEWMQNLCDVLKLEEHPKIISFSQNKYLQNSSSLGRLFQHIANQVVTKITYKRFTEEEEFNFIVHPYLLKQYNNRWFLLCMMDDENDSRMYNLALDRMLKISPVSTIPYRKCPKDLNDFFENIIGVTIFEDAKVEHIVMWASEHTFNYIRTKPLHESQTIIRGAKSEELKEKFNLYEEGAFFSIDCMNNYELIRELSSFGDQLLVLSPENIREEVYVRAKNMADRYEKIRKI